MRMNYQYTNYPNSKKLTGKSMRVGILTNPLFGATVGFFIGLGLLIMLTEYAKIVLPLTVVLMIVVPLLLRQYRLKKFKQYDAEYAKMMEAQRAGNDQAPEEKKAHMRV